MTDTKLTPDDFSADDLDQIHAMTGDYFGSPTADPFRLIRALYVIGHRKLGIDTKAKYVNTGPLRMRDISEWTDAHWDLTPDEEQSEQGPVDDGPKAGPSNAGD